MLEVKLMKEPSEGARNRMKTFNLKEMKTNFQRL